MQAMTVEVWHTLLEDCSYGECKQAVLYWMDNNPFAPQISDIKRLVAKMRNPDAYKSSDEAWHLVVQASSKFGFQGQSEAYKTFCDKTKRVLKTVKWWNVCYSERPEIVKNQFCKAWDNITESDKELGELPVHRALHIGSSPLSRPLPPKKVEKKDGMS